MNDNIFLIVMLFFTVIACIWYKLLFKLEEETREKLQEKHEFLIVKYNHLKLRSQKKKELLEIQDKLIKQLRDENTIIKRKKA